MRGRSVRMLHTLALLWMGLTVMACGQRNPAPSASQVPKRAAPSLRLVALTDISGYLEPCGCQSKLLGGIDRAAEKLKQLRADRVPVLFVAVGDTLLGPQPEGVTSQTDASTQERWKAETLVEIFNRLELAAATPGKRDLSFGTTELERLIGKSHATWLPAKPSAGDAPETAAGWLGQAGEIKVGMVGVSTFQGPEAELPSERVKALTERAQAEINRLRAAGARVVIGMISSDQRTGRRLAQGLHGLGFVIQGGIDEQTPAAPSRSGDTALVRAGRQGQGLLVVDLYLDGETQFADISEWSSAERKQGLQARIDDLAQRIADWEKDSTVDKANLAEQKAKLADLRAELAGTQPTAAAGGNAFSAAYLPLGQEQAKDPQVTSVLADYDARVNEHNRVAFAAVKPTPAPPGAPSYVGAAKCQGCHAPAYDWWSKHAHGRAYTTLERAHKQYNLSCVGCHVTGYNRPGGSTVVQNAGLTHVGCESCHGPGSLHAQNPAAAEHRPTKSPTQTVCKQCHTPEHSDLFEFATYAARLRAKGHGLPVGDAAPSPGKTH